MKGKRIVVNLATNLNRYEVKLATKCEYYSKILYSRRNCLEFTTDLDSVLLILSPIDGDYYSKLFVKLDTTRSTFLNVSYNFLKRVSSLSGRYTFYLTDQNYGLKLDGALNFTRI